MITMVKRLFISLLLALVSATMMWAENYPIMIGGVQVTSDNYQNITAAGGFSAVKSGAGTVTYDPATMTLTLANAVIKATGNGVHGIYLSGMSNDYTLVLAEGTTNTVTNDADNASPLLQRGSLIIEGGGACTFNGLHNWAIYKHMSNTSKLLTIRNCSVTATSGIAGYSDTNSNMVIDNATVRIMVTNNDRPIRYFNTVTLTNTQIVYPSGAEWNGTAHAICMIGSDTPITTEVVIDHHTPEPETVTNELVPNANYDVNKDGRVTLEDLTRLANVLVGHVNNPATGLSLSHSLVRLLVGNSAQLTATVTPANADFKALAWTTTDKRVATVSLSGLVTVVGNGSCYIVAQTLDGSSLRDSCQVSAIDPSTFDNGSGYVNLGLPSGTLWATKNIGANAPEEPGDKFAWGETSPKEEYTPGNYTQPTQLDYSDPNNSKLLLIDDAAYVNWGSNWRMPTTGDFRELYNGDYTDVIKTTMNGQYGYMITSKMAGYEGNSIFLPYTESSASYWTSSHLYMWVNEGFTYYGNYPFVGAPVRPVRKQ